MFMDLVSSTRLAETLGNNKYHLLLREFYADMTNPILRNQGEIYQYIGDEIVVSWPVLNESSNTNCLHCYTDMRSTIFLLQEKYIQKFGVVPDFKVGLHYGKVIAGEIGVIKREITFSGDVLNTTSRIQGKCNELHVKILTSDELLSILKPESSYLPVPLGNISLRGKEKMVAVSTLEFI